MSTRLMHVAVMSMVASLFALTIISPGCSKDASAPTTDPHKETATLRGVVSDADSSGSTPVSGATVSASGSEPVATDARGEFSLVLPAGTPVTVHITKPGYSLNELVVNLAPASAQTVSVSLLRVGALTTMSAATGGTIADGGYTFSMPPGFVNAQGNVTVSVTGLDPSTGQVRALPGGLEAIDANGAIRYLQPVSFAEYTVRDANGTVLQVSPSVSQGANIELPIPQYLQGSPGFNIGDPIECYLYDPQDGKWKTPVPGVIGPPSLDGGPAIKATIFHLSWYGGAPARNQRACIEGHVQDTAGRALAGVDVEAFTGGRARTDAQGFYRVDAAPGAMVRVVATVLENDSVLTGEVSVLTPENSDVCVQAPDIKITKRKKAFYRVTAYLFHTEGDGDDRDDAVVSITLDTDGGAVPYSGASVSLSTGETQVQIPLLTDGRYALSTPNLTPPFEAGEVRVLNLDFDGDGTTDATGSVQLPGSIEIIDPGDNATVPPRFTARWTDSGTDVNPYSARYFLTVAEDTVTFFTITEGLEFEVGDGSADSSIGVPVINSPLLPGDHTLEIMGINGDPWMVQGNQGQPTIVGENASGSISAFSIGASVDFVVEGLGKRGVSGMRTVPRRGERVRRPGQIPDDVRRFERLTTR